MSGRDLTKDEADSAIARVLDPERRLSKDELLAFRKEVIDDPFQQGRHYPKFTILQLIGQCLDGVLAARLILYVQRQPCENAHRNVANRTCIEYYSPAIWDNIRTENVEKYGCLRCRVVYQMGAHSCAEDPK